MAITSNTINVSAIPATGNDWHKSLYSADARDEEVIILGESGKTHYIKKLMFRCAVAGTVSIGSGSDGTMTTLHLGPIPLDASSGFFAISFGGKMGLKCDWGLSLVIITSAQAPIMIYAEGRTCKLSS